MQDRLLIVACVLLAVYIAAWWIAIRVVCGKRFHPWGWIPLTFVVFNAYFAVTMAPGKGSALEQLASAGLYILMPVGIIIVGIVLKIVQRSRTKSSPGDELL